MGGCRPWGGRCRRCGVVAMVYVRGVGVLAYVSGVGVVVGGVGAVVCWCGVVAVVYARGVGVLVM